MAEPHRTVPPGKAEKRGERLREEMESHLVAQTEENIRAGMTPARKLADRPA